MTKTKIIMEFETNEEFQEQLKRVQNYEIIKEEVPGAKELKNVEIHFSKDKTIISADGTQVVQTADGISCSVKERPNIVCKGKLSSLNVDVHGKIASDNKSFNELKKKITNELYNKSIYSYTKEEVEMLKILLESEKDR